MSNDKQSVEFERMIGEFDRFLTYGPPAMPVRPTKYELEVHAKKLTKLLNDVREIYSYIYKYQAKEQARAGFEQEVNENNPVTDFEANNHYTRVGTTINNSPSGIAPYLI